MHLRIPFPCLGRTLIIRNKAPHEKTNLQILKDTFTKRRSSSNLSPGTNQSGVSRAFHPPSSIRNPYKKRNEKIPASEKNISTSLSDTIPAFRQKPDLMDHLSASNILHSIERSDSPFDTESIESVVTNPLPELETVKPNTTQMQVRKAVMEYPEKLFSLAFTEHALDNLTTENTRKNIGNAVPRSMFLASNAKNMQQYLFWERYQAANQRLENTGFIRRNSAPETCSGLPVSTPLKARTWPEGVEHSRPHNLSQPARSLSGNIYR